jgi:hypothetical protein
MKSCSFRLISLICFFLCLTARGAETASAWGVGSMSLSKSGPAVLDKFYRCGGVGETACPTRCEISCDDSGLQILFRCTESNLDFPAMLHGTNWQSLHSSPLEQDSAFPDKVDLFVQPDMKSETYFQFAMTLEGLKFGCERKASEDSGEEGDSKASSTKKIEDFAANVSKGKNSWTAKLRIPWATLGGKPSNYFGLLPIRTRWRDGEVSSPVAFDFTERPPTDLFIETHFGKLTSIQAFPETLCTLPSGMKRWQKPALLQYPNAKTKQRIWEMQNSLSRKTGADNFANRLYLTQQWTDLLALEGLNFRPTSGSIAPEDLRLFSVRRKINAALGNHEVEQACQLLDKYLQKLRAVSADWFADSSPGGIAASVWKIISRARSVETAGDSAVIHCLAGEQNVDLSVSFPESGGVRLTAGRKGFFNPASLMPLRVAESGFGWIVENPQHSVQIHREPFQISIRDGLGSFTPVSLAFRFDGDGRIAGSDLRMPLAADEIIYGFGERYDHFNQRGRVVTLWGMDDWNGNTEGLMNETYKAIPVFHSSMGYSIFENSSYRLRADAGATESNTLRLTQPGPIFDDYIWSAPPETALQSYAKLTGTPILPPKWAFEPWAGRTGRGWKNTPLHDPVAEEESVMMRFKQLDIPHSAIYSEGGGADSAKLNLFMTKHGIKVLSWYYPAINHSTQSSLLPNLIDSQLPLLRAGNKKETDDLGYVDFTNPNALELSRRWWKHRLDLGVAGSMVDFGDRVPEDATFYDGRRGDEMHNAYSYEYQKTYSEVFAEKRTNDYVLIGRAAAPGTQKWVSQFGGDHPANFAGLQSVLTGALTLSSCGFSIWGSDLGGFLGWPEPAVYMRWTEFGCFSPLMRCHGRTPREPWNFGDAAVTNYSHYAWVRENLLDYIYDNAILSHETGLPIMRSMAVAFPKEGNLSGAGDQYMFGTDLLVAPVVTAANEREIGFPRGSWTSLWDGERVTGPVSEHRAVALDQIPVYLKPGAIVPVSLNPGFQFGQSMTHGRVKAVIVTPPAAKAQFNLPAKKLAQANYLMIYGFADATARINGVALRKMPNSESIKRTIFQLPSNISAENEISVTVDLHE